MLSEEQKRSAREIEFEQELENIYKNYIQNGKWLNYKKFKSKYPNHQSIEQDTALNDIIKNRFLEKLDEVLETESAIKESLFSITRRMILDENYNQYFLINNNNITQKISPIYLAVYFQNKDILTFLNQRTELNLTPISYNGFWSQIDQKQFAGLNPQFSQIWAKSQIFCLNNFAKKQQELYEEKERLEQEKKILSQATKQSKKPRHFDNKNSQENIKSSEEIIQKEAVFQKQKSEFKEERALFLNNAMANTPKILLSILYKNVKETNPQEKIQYELAINNLKHLIIETIEQGGNFSAIPIAEKQQYQFILLKMASDIKDNVFSSQLMKIIPKTVSNYYHQNSEAIKKMLEKVESPPSQTRIQYLSDIRTLYSNYYLYESRKVSAIDLNDENDCTTAEDISTISDFTDDGSCFSEVISLSSQAKPFFPKIERDNQVKTFLANRVKIRSIADLPLFLQYEILEIQEITDAYFAIKGGAVNSKRRQELPDLDIEIAVPNITTWSKQEVQELARRIIPQFDIMEVQTHHQQQDGVVFSLNFKDDSGLDISIYDRNHLPDPKKSWSTSKDIKIFFDESGKAFYCPPDINRTGFYLNPHSRDLPLRTCFTKMFNPDITNQDLDNALRNDLYPYNMIDLFYYDLKLYQYDEESHAVIIENKIENFCQKHHFDQDLRNIFISNMNNLLTKHHSEFLSPVYIAQYQTIFTTLTNLMNIKEVDDPTEIEISQKIANDLPQKTLKPKTAEAIVESFNKVRGI